MTATARGRFATLSTWSSAARASSVASPWPCQRGSIHQPRCQSSTSSSGCAPTTPMTSPDSLRRAGPKHTPAFSMLARWRAKNFSLSASLQAVPVTCRITSASVVQRRKAARSSGRSRHSLMMQRAVSMLNMMILIPWLAFTPFRRPSEKAGEEESGYVSGLHKKLADSGKHFMLLLPVRHVPAARDDLADRRPLHQRGDALRMLDGAVFVLVTVNGEHRTAYIPQGGFKVPVTEVIGEPGLDPRIQHPLRLVAVIAAQAVALLLRRERFPCCQHAFARARLDEGLRGLGDEREALPGKGRRTG